MSKSLKSIILIIYLVLCGEAFKFQSESKLVSSMSAKLRMCYQNLGFCSESSRKWHDIMNVLNTRDPHILFVSETMIDVDSITRLEALGFQIEAMPIYTERIWCAVKEGVHYKRVTDLELPDFPAIWLEVGRGASSYYVCGLYREFTRLDNVKESRKLGKQRERFQKFLEKASKANDTGKEVHILGDWNLNKLKWLQNNNGRPGWKFQPLVDDLFDALLNNGFVNNVDQITRISGKLESILDLHLCNRPNKVGRVLVTHDTKSDHFTLTVTRSKPDQVGPKVFEGRSWRKVDWDKLTKLIYQCHGETLKSICRVRDVNELVNRFTAWSNVLLDAETPVKKTEMAPKFTPWMTPEVKKLVKEKKLALKKFQRTHLDIHCTQFHKLRTKVSNECAKAEHEYWKKNLADGVDSQSMWGIGKKFLGIKSPGAPSQIIVDGQMINDPEKVANGCNEALLNKVKNATSNLPPSYKDPLDYTRDFVASLNKCTFNYPTCNLTRGVGYREVKRAIKELKYTNAEGVDHLCTRFVKKLRKPLLHVFTCICNRSFEQEKFPDLYQLARVCLLCKDPKDPFNPLKYRPISILPAPSKVLEKVVVNRLVNHMERTGFSPDEQHGYRPKRSCATAVVTMQEEILKDLEMGADNLLIFVDLSNAFDTLPHQNILGKLRVYGFTESSVNWYRSYLKHRAQFVGLAGAKSEIKKIIGIACPQGSLSGCVLFSLVFGDIVIIKLDTGAIIFIKYADDLTIRVRLCKNVAVDEITINRQMKSVIEWLNCNRLVINHGKTELLLITRGTREIYKDLKLTVGDHVVRPKRAVRMLGMWLTYNMRQDWFINQMPNNLISFLNQRMYFLSKIKNKCGPEQFKLLAYGFLYSKISYCAQVYSNCTEVLKDKIRMVLNRCVRLATNSKLSDRRKTKSMYYELKFLTFDSVVDTQDLNLLWSVMYTNTPKHLSDQVWSEARRRRELGGPQTRSVTDPNRVPFSRDNVGTYTMRRNGWMSRSLVKYDQLLREEGEFYRRMTGELDMKKRKKMLKEFFLERDLTR